MHPSFLVLDDHELVRNGIINIVRGFYPCSSIIDCKDVFNAIKIIRSQSIDVLFLDLSIPHLEPASFIKDILNEYPRLNIIVLSSLDPRLYALKLYKLGIKAYLFKNKTDQNEIVKSIEIVMNNRVYFSDVISEIISLQQLNLQERVNLDQLTTRELFIIENLIEGKTMKMIAKELNISYSTITGYKIKIFKKLNISSILEIQK